MLLVIEIDVEKNILFAGFFIIVYLHKVFIVQMGRDNLNAEKMESQITLYRF